jgi:hypothetical protein
MSPIMKAGRGTAIDIAKAGFRVRAKVFGA